MVSSRRTSWTLWLAVLAGFVEPATSAEAQKLPACDSVRTTHGVILSDTGSGGLFHALVQWKGTGCATLTREDGRFALPTPALPPREIRLEALAYHHTTVEVPEPTLLLFMTPKEIRLEPICIPYSPNAVSVLPTDSVTGQAVALASGGLEAALEWQGLERSDSVLVRHVGTPGAWRVQVWAPGYRTWDGLVESVVHSGCTPTAANPTVRLLLQHRR